MDILAIAAVVVFILWVVDRLVRGPAAAGRLRDREDAKRVGGAAEGIGDALPWLGTSGVQLPPAPPSVSLEPDLGDHVLRVDRGSDPATDDTGC